MDKTDNLSRREQTGTESGRGAASHEPGRPPLREVPPTPTPVTESSEAGGRSSRTWLRRVMGRRFLMVVGPLLLLAVVLGVYLSGGRYVTTDNAYVRADKVMINTDVGGIVAEIAVHEGDQVAAGQVLFRLDGEAYRIAVAAAEAKLAMVRNEIANLQATYRQHVSETHQEETNVAFFEREFKRQTELAGRQAAAEIKVDQARHDLDNARDGLAVSRQEAQAALAELGGSADQPIEAHAQYRQALAELEKTQRDLRRTTVVAPTAGTVTKVDNVQVGTYLPPATAAFSLVAKDSLWIEANPKETDLAHLKLGNPATVMVDSYPNYQWRGVVESISPATGAEFALIPAQNASGNWVKVVQRVPVRVRIESPEDVPPLRAGMSATVKIDTGYSRSLGSLWHDMIAWF